ncbi:hypothetical protein GCM10028805_35760 [Spirosoma harenae]
MDKRLLFCSILGMLTACHGEDDIQPDALSLSREAAGTYRTNFYLDPSSATLPASQMPFTELKAESDSSVTLAYTKLYPSRETQVLKHVLLTRQTEGIQLRLADSSIGTLQTDRVFTNNGMEKQGQLLRINAQVNQPNSVNFTGSKE